MAESLIIDLENQDKEPEQIDNRYLMIIGFIAQELDEFQQFPLPLMRRTNVARVASTIDGRQVNSGLLPTDEEDSRLYEEDSYYENAMAGEVVAKKGFSHGWGATYTGRLNGLQENGGFILLNPIIPIVPENELAIVKTFADGVVVESLDEKFNGLHVAYDLPEVIGELGKVAFDEFLAIE